MPAFQDMGAPSERGQQKSVKIRERMRRGWGKVDPTERESIPLCAWNDKLGIAFC